MNAMDASFWSLQFRDLLNVLILLATIAAIVWGPIKAVQITRANDDAREKLRRQFDIFHSLMKTRRFVLSPEHVMALNMVQVDFYKKPKIDAAYRIYMALLSREVPQPADPTALRFFEEQEDALYDLLYEIGAELGYHYDKRDLKKLAYGPRGWETEETQQRSLRGMMVELLAGRRAVPVADWEKVYANSSKFPPPPRPD